MKNTWTYDQTTYSWKPLPATYGSIKIGPTTPPDILFVQGNQAREIIRVTPKGEIYWKTRLVETDDDFKMAMLDLAEHFKSKWF